MCYLGHGRHVWNAMGMCLHVCARVKRAHSFYSFLWWSKSYGDGRDGPDHERREPLLYCPIMTVHIIWRAHVELTESIRARILSHSYFSSNKFNNFNIIFPLNRNFKCSLFLNLQKACDRSHVQSPSTLFDWIDKCTFKWPRSFFSCAIFMWAQHASMGQCLNWCSIGILVIHINSWHRADYLH